MPKTPREPIGQLDVIFIEENRDIVPMNRRPVDGDMVTEDLAIGLTKHTMFVRGPGGKTLYALTIPRELAEEMPLASTLPVKLEGTFQAILRTLIEKDGCPQCQRKKVHEPGCTIGHAFAAVAGPDDAIEALFRWRDSLTDRYGDDLVSLLMAEYSPDEAHAHHNACERVPDEHKPGLLAFRALSYEEQERRVEAYCARP